MPSTRSFARKTLVAALASAPAWLSGCASEPSVESDRPVPAERRAASFPINAETWTQLGYRQDWSGFPSLGGGARIAFVLPGKDVIAVQETGGALSLLETSTGGQRWSELLGGPLTKFIGVARTNHPRHGEVVIGATQAELFLLSTQTGALLDRQRLQRVSNTRPLLIGDVAVFGTPTGELQGHLLTRGVGVWAFASSGAFEQSPIVAADTFIVAATRSGDVIFLDASGTLAARARMFGGPGAALASGPDAVYIASEDQSLYAFAMSGREIWRHRSNRPLRSAPVYHDGTVYCSLPGEGLTAFDGSTGQVRWASEASGEVAAVRRGKLVVRDGSRVALVDPISGGVEFAAEIAGLDALVPDTLVDGNLYAVSTSGVVTRFIPR